MKWLSNLLNPPRPAHGAPITLEFKCGDTITNARPPVVPEGIREIAIRQASDTRCPKCAYALWRGLDVDDSLPEMRAMLIDAWEQP